MDAFAEARPGVICVLLLATLGAGLTGNLLLLEASPALAGGLPIGVVFERSTPADRGPSATPTHERKIQFNYEATSTLTHSRHYWGNGCAAEKSVGRAIYIRPIQEDSSWRYSFAKEGNARECCANITDIRRRDKFLDTHMNELRGEERAIGISYRFAHIIPSHRILDFFVRWTIQYPNRLVFRINECPGLK